MDKCFADFQFPVVGPDAGYQTDTRSYLLSAMYII